MKQGESETKRMELTKEEVQKIIDYEIVVDCYTEEEANLGWAIYMEDNINYPFEAEYEVKKKSGERQWKKVQVVNNETDESSFDGGDYYVEIEYEEIVIPVRLDELKTSWPMKKQCKPFRSGEAEIHVNV